LGATRAVQGLSFGGGGEGIGLRVGGLLQAQAQAQLGGGLGAPAGALDDHLLLLQRAAAAQAAAAHRESAGGHAQPAHHSPSHHGGGGGGPPAPPPPAPLHAPRAASAELPGAGFLAGLDAQAILAAAAAGAASVGGGAAHQGAAGYGGRMGRAGSERLSGEGGGRYASGGPADARAGPRIFVGKLNKETTEGDVRVRAARRLHLRARGWGAL